MIISNGLLISIGFLIAALLNLFLGPNMYISLFLLATNSIWIGWVIHDIFANRRNQ